MISFSFFDRELGRAGWISSRDVAEKGLITEVHTLRYIMYSFFVYVCICTSAWHLKLSFFIIYRYLLKPWTILICFWILWFSIQKKLFFHVLHQVYSIRGGLEDRFIDSYEVFVRQCTLLMLVWQQLWH